MLEVPPALMVLTKCNLHVADLNEEVYQARVTNFY